MELASEPVLVELSIPSMSEFVGIIRLAVSGIATRMNFTIEEIEDIKIAVSEACTNSVQYAYNQQDGRIDVVCQLYSDRLEIIVKDTGKGFDIEKALLNPGKKDVPEDPDKLGLGLGLTFIKSLMDETSFSSEEGKGTTIKMVKLAPVKKLVL